jgi:hypothetical protein
MSRMIHANGPSKPAGDAGGFFLWGNHLQNVVLIRASVKAWPARPWLCKRPITAASRPTSDQSGSLVLPLGDRPARSGRDLSRR